MQSLWPEPMLIRLKELLADHKSSGQAAYILSEEYGVVVTRNAVIGKAHRMGIALNKPNCRRDPDLPKRAERSKRPPRPRPDPIPFTEKKRKAPEPLAEPIVIAIAAPFVACDPVTFFDLESHHCRYIAGDPREDFDLPMYCGARVKPGSSYCPHHHALMWVKPQKKSAPHPFRMREVA